jgi:hypothetical protein
MPPMRRRFQFSLRALLILMLAVACFFGGIRFERERRRREDAAADAVSAKSKWDQFKSFGRTSRTVPTE